MSKFRNSKICNQNVKNHKYSQLKFSCYYSIEYLWCYIFADVTPVSSSPSPVSPVLPPGVICPPRHRRRRARTMFDDDALSRLESVFLVDQYPDIAMREQLAEQIGVPEARVQVWIILKFKLFDFVVQKVFLWDFLSHFGSVLHNVCRLSPRLSFTVSKCIIENKTQSNICIRKWWSCKLANWQSI